MNKAFYIKRLEAVEESISSGVNIVVWGGLPPIHVQISTGTGVDCKSKLKLFDSMEEVSNFLETKYFGVEPIILTSGDDILSSEFYSYCG